MSGLEGVDYAWDRPDINTLWNNGKRFVARYLAFLPNGKVLQKAELDKLHQKGFGVILNWEQASGDMFAGFSRGVTHAREALRQANALGAPSWVPIYFSCDQDVTTKSAMQAVASYLDGAASVLGRNRVGVYGEYMVIETMLPGAKPDGYESFGDHAMWGWQTYAWSGGKNSGKAHFKQYRNGVQLAGADLDLNVSLKDPFGAWFPGGFASGTPEVMEDKVELSDVVHLPKDAYPAGGESATVETILGWTNGRVIYLEQAVGRLEKANADLAAKLDRVLGLLGTAQPQAAESGTSLGKVYLDVEAVKSLPQE